MKRLFSYFAAFATMFAIASCQEEIAQPDVLVDGDSKTVTFSVEAPTLPQTKAFGDGTQDLKLLCAVYVGKGNTIGTTEGTFLGGKFEVDDDILLDGGAAPQIVRGTTEAGKVKWDVTLTLVKNFKYDIVFWAQTVPAQGLSPYTFVPEDGQIVATYAGDANDETRDAFYFLCDDYNVMNPNDSKISLVRPFAQINLGAADYDALTHLGITDLTSAISSAEATATVPNTLNLLDGTVEGAEEVSFVKTAAPVGDVTANNIVIGTGADAKTFRLVGMNYILADVKTANPTVDLTMNFNYNGVDLDIDVPSVPYARNYKTNIVGNFFTDDAEFEVVIAPMFEKEDEIYNTDLTLAEAFEVDRDVTLVLKEDQVISEPLILANGKTLTLNLDQYTISASEDLWDSSNDVWSMISVRNGSTLIINSNTGSVIARENDAYAVDVRDEGSTLEINGGTYVGNISAVYVKEGTAKINGGSYSIQQLSEPANGSDERFTLNCLDDSYTTGKAEIIVTGGSFTNFDPSNNLAEGQGTNFLADGYVAVPAVVEGKTVYTVKKNAVLAAIAAGDAAVTIDGAEEFVSPVVIEAGKTFEVTLGENAVLTSHNSDANIHASVFEVHGELVINGNGNVDAGSGAASNIAVWARGENAKVTINGGYFTNGADAAANGSPVIYASKKNAQIIINGGTFEAGTQGTGFSQPLYAALNLYDSAAADGAMITVYGGTFINFDPSNPGTETAAWNAAHPNGFVADGYTVEMEEKEGKTYYTVVEEQFTAGKYWITGTKAGKTNVMLPLATDKEFGYPSSEAAVNGGGYLDNVFTFTAVEGGFTIQDPSERYYYQEAGTEYKTFAVGTDNTLAGCVWTITKLEDGTFKIVNAASGKTVRHAEGNFTSFGVYADNEGEGSVLVNLVDASAATERPVLIVSPESKTVAAEVKEFSFDITSNVAWTVTAGKGVSLDKTSGNGNASVKMTFDDINTTTEAKKYTATVSATGFDDIVVTVTQSGVSSGNDKVVTFNVGDYTFANQTALTSYVIKNENTSITFAFDGGGNNNSPKYYTSGTAVRCYPKNTITVTGEDVNGENVTIKKIEVVAPKGYTNAIDLYSGGTKLESFIWEGSSTKPVVLTFDPNKSSGQSRFVNINVTYE